MYSEFLCELAFEFFSRIGPVDRFGLLIVISDVLIESGF
jgi:hypothetical protein